MSNRWIQTLVVIGALGTSATVTRAATCETPQNPRSPLFVAGTNLATGFLTHLPIAELGPVSVFFSECAPATATFATQGVYSNVDSFVRAELDGSLTLVDANGPLTYQASGGQFRKVPDDGTFIVIAGGDYVLRSQTSPDQKVFRWSGTRHLLAEVKRVVGDTTQPFQLSYFYDRDANGALMAIRQSNSGDRITVERGIDFVRVQYFLTGRSVAADSFVVYRTAGRLTAVDVPGPSATARIGYTLGATGRLLEVAHPSGAVTKYGHRADGRINGATIYEAQGAAPAVHGRQTFSYAFDIDGMTTSVAKSGDGVYEAMQYGFTNDGLLRKITVGAIDTVLVTYDGSSRISRADYPDRNESLVYTYSGATETITRLTRGDGVTIYDVTALDPSGYLPTQYTENGLPTSISYDALSRPIVISTHDGATTRASFTAISPSIVKACKLEEATGEQTCTQIDYANGGRIVAESTGYAGFGAADHVVQYTYDANGNLIRSTHRIGATLAREANYASYDHRGLPASWSVTDLVMGGPRRTATFRYFANGSLSSITDEEGVTRRFAYDAIGQIRQMTIERRDFEKSATTTYAAASPIVTVDVGARPACGEAASVTVNGSTTSTRAAEDNQPPPPNCDEEGDGKGEGKALDTRCEIVGADK